MKFLSPSFSIVRLPNPSQNFRLFPDFLTWCGEPVRIIIERLLSPRCYKRLPIRRLEVASRK